MKAIGVNGFGRIGRMVVREAFERGANIVAINDPNKSLEYIAYLLKYDTIHGRFKRRICITDKTLLVNDHEVRIFHQPDIKHIRWLEAGVEYVIEASGVFCSYNKLVQHLKNGVKKVILAAPSGTVPMFVYGVNLHKYNPEMRIISSGSCTANCLALLAKVVNDKFHIKQGLITTTHPTSSSHKPLESSSSADWRTKRSRLQNIIPSTTSATSELERIIPELKGKLTGISVFVPIANVSLMDMCIQLGKPVSFEELKKEIRTAAKGNLKNVLGYTEEYVISADFNIDPRTAVFDAKASVALSDSFVKLIAWYDNQYGFTCRLFDLIDYIHNTDE